MTRARLWIVLACAAAALAGGYLLWRSRPWPVAIVPVRAGAADELVYATGFVEPEQPVSVAARLTAPVVRVLVREGDRVRRGQALVLLDDENQRALLTQAAAQRRGAVLAETRTLALFGQGWVTRAARDAATATADAARATEQAARAQVGQAVVRAGIDGVVLKRDVEPGDLATPARVLMLLGDPARIRVTATVDERDVAHVRPGQPVLMSSDAWPGRIIRGHVREITPGGDPDQRAFRARLALDDRAALPIGMTFEVNIVTRRAERALLVPASAVAEGGLWIDDDGRARRRAVRTGIVGADVIQILSGVATGDRVIDSPPAGLAEGDRVRARPAAR